MQQDSQSTFFWHDYETFGINPKFDRPAQFAGVRTDLDFNVIGEPVNIYCQPPTDTLPHPEACLLTGISPQHAAAEGLPEPEFITKILAELSEPNTISVGYNSLRFDDEVTRHTLFRNFHDPYEREWKNGCGRWDIIDLARATYALRPDGIQWPTNDDGVTAFKLEWLAKANNIQQDHAHDALSDVYATIGLAKLIRDKQPRLYDYVFNNRSKQAVQALINTDSKEPLVHVSSRFPAAQGCLSLVMPLMPHPQIKTQTIVYDLRYDPSVLALLDADDLRDRLFTPTADLPEDVERIHLKAIHSNRCPFIASVKTLTDDTITRCQLDMNACRKHWKWLNDHLADIAPMIAKAFAEHEFTGSNDPEQALYDGFISNADKSLSQQVRQMSAAELTAMSDSGKPAFQDNRLAEMLFRYRARYHPESLNDIEREEFQQWRHNRLAFAPDGGLTFEEYFVMIEHLRNQLAGDERHEAMLEKLFSWGKQLQTKP